MPVPFVGGHPRRWGILKDSRNAHLLYMAPLDSECCRFFFLRIQIYQLSAHFIVLRLDKAENFADVLIEVKGSSQFPGQTGNNNNNFHFEDCISKITHIVTGILKLKVTRDDKPK